MDDSQDETEPLIASESEFPCRTQFDGSCMAISFEDIEAIIYATSHSIKVVEDNTDMYLKSDTVLKWF